MKFLSFKNTEAPATSYIGDDASSFLSSFDIRKPVPMAVGIVAVLGLIALNAGSASKK